MRKYIKSMRQQYDNNSLIFKQAKKMFHYQPHTSQGRPYCYSKPSKNSKAKANEFKDEYSSVKDNKLQSNEINQSSWIAKLVNGIQENSLEDLRLFSKQIEKKQPDKIQNSTKQLRKSFNKHNVSSTFEKKKEYQPAAVTEAPTKKNSFNFSKKKSDAFIEKNQKSKHKNESFYQNQKKERPKPESAVCPKSKSKALSPNVSQPVIKKSNDKRQLSTKMKSFKNICVSKGLFSKRSLNQGESKLSTLKSAQKIQIGSVISRISKKNLHQKDFKGYLGLDEIQQVKCFTQKKHKNLNQNVTKQKDIQFLDCYYSQPLFQQPGDEAKRSQALKIQKKIPVGSIRKNKTLTIKKQEKGSSNCSFRQQSTQVMMSPRFSSNNMTLKELINEKPAQQSSLVAKQQKGVAENYLRTDYSFKCNPIEAYNSLAKPAAAKKHIDKKFNYGMVQNILSQSTNRFIQTFNARDLKKEGYRHYSEQQFNQQLNHQILKGDFANEILAQKIRYNCNRNTMNNQNYGQLSKTISKEVYLHDSMQCVLSQVTNQANYMANIDIKTQIQYRGDLAKKNNPTKYSYIVSNSSQKEQIGSGKDYVQNTCGRRPQLKAVEGSEKLIDRLNSKLNTYINQYQLAKQDQPEILNMGQNTYRTMQLNFNQLKKHRGFAQK